MKSDRMLEGRPVIYNLLCTLGQVGKKGDKAASDGALNKISSITVVMENRQHSLLKPVDNPKGTLDPLYDPATPYL